MFIHSLSWTHDRLQLHRSPKRQLSTRCNYFSTHNSTTSTLVQTQTLSSFPTPTNRYDCEQQHQSQIVSAINKTLLFFRLSTLFWFKQHWEVVPLSLSRQSPTCRASNSLVSKSSQNLNSFLACTTNSQSRFPNSVTGIVV